MPLNQLTRPSNAPSSISIPPEIRVQIFKEILSIPRTIKIFWSENTQKFYTNAPIPPLFHVSHESRSSALSHYTLAFGDSPEKCKIYFSYTHDTADFQWSYLARYSGSGVNYEVLRTKLGTRDYEGLSRVTLKEGELMGRATNSFADLREFKAFIDVFVVCDRSARDVDRNWSAEILQDLWNGLDEDAWNWGQGKENWPKLWCDRCTNGTEGSESACSRHCKSPSLSYFRALEIGRNSYSLFSPSQGFFDQWNQYAQMGQHRKWAPLLAESLHVTCLDSHSPETRTRPAKHLFRMMVDRRWSVPDLDFIPCMSMDPDDSDYSD
jgi:hypothetical protein